MISVDSQIKLPRGQIVITRDAAKTLSIEDVAVALGRHFGGKPRDETALYRQRNDRRRPGCRLLSVHRSRTGLRFWVVTDTVTSVTTLLLPGEPRPAGRCRAQPQRERAKPFYHR